MKKLHKKRLNGWVKWLDRRVIGSTHDCAVAKLYIIHVFACRATPDKLFVCMFLYIYICSRGLNCLNVCFFVFRHDVYLSGYAWQALCVHVCVYVVGGWTVWMSVSLFTRMMCMFIINANRHLCMFSWTWSSCCVCICVCSIVVGQRKTCLIHRAGLTFAFCIGRALADVAYLTCSVCTWAWFKCVM